MIDYLMTREDQEKEVAIILEQYNEYCITHPLEDLSIEARVKAFSDLIRSAMNTFVSTIEEGNITGTKLEWIAFYHGFLNGMETQQMEEAKRKGAEDKIREIRGI